MDKGTRQETEERDYDMQLGLRSYRRLQKIANENSVNKAQKYNFFFFSLSDYTNLSLVISAAFYYH